MSDSPTGSVLAAIGGGRLPGLAGTVPNPPAVADLKVAPGQLSRVAGVIEAQASALEDQLASHLAGLRMDSPAEDTVSTRAFEAWNYLLTDGPGSYAQRVRGYVQGLRQLAQQLRTAGDRYRGDDTAHAARVQQAGG